VVESEVGAIADDDIRYVRVRPSRLDGWRYDGGETEAVRPVEFAVEPTLPEYLL
jgi:hypothetical protein